MNEDWRYGHSLADLHAPIELHVTGGDIDVCVFYQYDGRRVDGTPWRIQYGHRHDGAVVGRENDGPWLALKVIEGLFSKQFIWPSPASAAANPCPTTSNAKWHPPTPRDPEAP